MMTCGQKILKYKSRVNLARLKLHLAISELKRAEAAMKAAASIFDVRRKKRKKK